LVTQPGTCPPDIVFAEFGHDLIGVSVLDVDLCGEGDAAYAWCPAFLPEVEQILGTEVA
jgi:hypothetical protein